MTDRDLINEEIKRGNLVRIIIKNSCNQHCNNYLCIKAGVEKTYNVLHQGSWAQCIITLENLCSDGKHRILQYCSLSIGNEYKDESGASVVYSSDGFIINMADDSYIFIDRSNVASVMTYPRPGTKSTVFKSKNRGIFKKSVMKNIKSP